MTILDTNLMLANALAVSAAAGTATLASVIDLGAAVKNVVAGEKLFALISITTAFTSAGAATVDFKFVTDAQDPIATDGTATFHGSTGPLAYTALTAGKQIMVGLNPLGGSGLTERYLGCNITTATATTTAGAVTIHIVAEPELTTNWRAYSDAVN